MKYASFNIDSTIVTFLNNNEIKFELYEGKRTIEIKKVAIHKSNCCFGLS